MTRRVVFRSHFSPYKVEDNRSKTQGEIGMRSFLIVMTVTGYSAPLTIRTISISNMKDARFGYSQSRIVRHTGQKCQHRTPEGAIRGSVSIFAEKTGKPFKHPELNLSELTSKCLRPVIEKKGLRTAIPGDKCREPNHRFFFV